MKQGPSRSVSAGHKTEPVPNKIGEGAVSRIGGHYITTVDQPMHKGRGYSAPGIGQSNHKSGSQNKH